MYVYNNNNNKLHWIWSHWSGSCVVATARLQGDANERATPLSMSMATATATGAPDTKGIDAAKPGEVNH
jgi:hypothetical protein